MSLGLNQNSVSTAIVTAVIIGSCIALLSVTLILLTGVYLYVGDIWEELVKNREVYLEWDRLRKDWNKKAKIEIRRRFIMGFILTETIQRRGISQEDAWRYRSMVSV
jgi:hypothetical protein